jgi:hypothetical protein
MQQPKAGSFKVLQEEHDKKCLVKSMRFYSNIDDMEKDLEKVNAHIKQLETKKYLDKEFLQKLKLKKAYITDQIALADNFFFAVGINDSQEVSDFLENPDINVNLQFKDGITPLHCAVVNRFHDVAALLIEKNANPHAADKKGVTPLILAKRNTKIMELFEAAQKKKDEEKELAAQKKLRIEPAERYTMDPAEEKLLLSLKIALAQSLTNHHPTACIPLHPFLNRPGDSIHLSNEDHKERFDKESTHKTENLRRALALQQFNSGTCL